MATRDAVSAASTLGVEKSATFTCAEIWGGNRPFDGPVELPGIRGRLFSRPCAGGRGGDIHYVSICGSGLISRMCLADVVGHGEAVAQVSGEIHALLRRYMNNVDQRRVLSELNRRLVASGLGAMTTAVAVTYVPPTRTLSISYAGHPPPWFYAQAEDRWVRLTPPSAAQRDRRPIDLPLAIDADTTFTRRKQRVVAGDRLLVVTDGVLETPGAAGELFGERRLEAVLREHGRAGVDELTDRVLEALRKHAGARGLIHDDVTLFLAEFVRGPRMGGSLWLILKNRLLGVGRRARRRVSGS